MGPSAARRSRVVPAWLALAAMLFASAGALFPAHDAIDIACAAALVEQHDHSAHRIAAEPGHGPDHCDACHLARTARGAVTVHQLAAATAGPVRTAFLAPEPVRRIDLLTDGTRAPPRL